MFYIVLFFIVLVDQITKYYSQLILAETSYSFFAGILFFELYINTGIAFSLPLNGAPLKFITIILISFIFYYYKKYEDTKNSLINIGYGLLIGGAIGNAIGRIFQNGVIDFIGIKYFSVFNIADIAISAGILLLIYIHYAKGYITPNRD